MGLDAYLYKLEEGWTKESYLKATEKNHEAEHDYYENHYNEANEREVNDKLRKKHVTDVAPEPPAEHIEIDHPKYPDHLFKIGYWRSSYNEGGINSIARKYGFPDLYQITFGDKDEDDGSEYHVWPNWMEVWKRAEAALVKYDEVIGKLGGVSTRTVRMKSWGPGSKPTNEQEALTTFLKHREQMWERTDSGNEAYSYSSAEGEFWMAHPQEIVAAIPGTEEWLGTAEPCMYLMLNEEIPETYRQSLEIVRDTALHCIDQGPEALFYLGWSA